ncbi:MAG: acylphosphatase [Pirellulales bacterium]
MGDVSPSSLRRTVWFAGRVQGVGFRATATGIASRYQVSGCVENLPDGRVRLVAEGAAAEIERFLSELRTGMHAYIRYEQSEDGPATGEFHGFRIRR